MRNEKVLFLTRAAVIAALYVALSAVSGLFGLSSGVIQVRISEALCVLAAFTPAAIPGLTLGCLIYNAASGCIAIDVALGTVATLIGATATWFLAATPLTKKKAFAFLLPLPTVFSNALIVPYVLTFYGVETGYLFNFGTVFLGEFIACEIVGMVLYFALLPIKGRLFRA